MTRKSEISTENTCSMGVQDIRGGVTLKRLILQSLECKLNGMDHTHGNDLDFWLIHIHEKDYTKCDI